MDYPNETYNETLETCQEPYYTDKSFVETLVLFIGMIFMCTLCRIERRKGCQCCKYCCCCYCCCQNHCGMIVAVNFLENKEDRAMVLSGFILMTNTIKDAVFGDEIESSVPIVKMLLKIIYVFGICIASFPLLSTIGMESLCSQVLGIVYTVFFVAMDVLVEIKFCEKVEGTDTRYLRLIFYIPATLYLLISYVRRIVIIKKGQRFDTNYLWKHYQIEYVRKLLTPLSKDSSLSVKSEKLIHKIRNAVYARLSGFRYSLLILISIGIGFVLLTLATIELTILLFEFYVTMRKFLTILEDTIDVEIPNVVLILANRLLNKQIVSQPSALKKGITFVELLFGQLNILVWSIFLAGFVSFLLACVTFILMLVSYKRVALNMRKKVYKNEKINLERMNPVNLVVNATQFGGYQVAHIIWGCILQFIVFFVIFILLGEIIILPLVYANWQFFLVILNYASPYILVIVLSYVVQRILVKHCFLQDNGKILALNNRKGFYNMMYFMFFYNILAGFIGCFMRMIKSVIFGLWFFPRLDTSIFPRSFESLDSGFVAYLCLVKLEDVQGNNILRIFVYLLLHRRGQMIRRRFKSTSSLKAELLANALRGRVLRKNARNRWFLIWTLIHNPELSKLRKLADDRIDCSLPVSSNRQSGLSFISNIAADLNK